MRNVPFWIDSAPIKRFPRLERNVNVDDVVVGTSTTGITTAHLLKETGLKVPLIERERVASMDTGHTTAHLTCITDVELQGLARTLGEDHAQGRMGCRRGRHR
jgi:glycine/D-amino acid oxidase-like deaminating enzyme